MNHTIGAGGAQELSIRSLRESDFESIVDYFLNGDEAFLLGMGVEIAKLPTREAWLEILMEEFFKPLDNKVFFYMIWEVNERPVGHCNINKIIFGEEAYMHLHMWHPGTRDKGLGFELVKLSIPCFFKLYNLKRIFCEPYALNPAPNRMMQKLGFDFIKRYDTVPGWINSYQPVNQWCLTAEKYEMLYRIIS